MLPFRDDVAMLAARLRNVVGEGLVEFRVPALPPEMTARRDRTRRSWSAPRPGTGIVIVSDLGRSAERAGRIGPRAAWSAFLGDVEAKGFAPVVLVPGRRSSYAGYSLRRTLLFGWDRAARLVEVMQFVKDRR
jgi:hypothetical protein